MTSWLYSTLLLNHPWVQLSSSCLQLQKIVTDCFNSSITSVSQAGIRKAKNESYMASVSTLLKEFFWKLHLMTLVTFHGPELIAITTDYQSSPLTKEIRIYIFLSWECYLSEQSKAHFSKDEKGKWILRNCPHSLHFKAYRARQASW